MNIRWDSLELDPRPLSVGATSEVFLARLGSRTVIVKVADTDAEVAALERLARSKHHAAAPALIGITTTPSGRVALVREFVDGISLAALIERAMVRRRWQGGRRWNAPTRTMVAALCDALAGLHDAGLVHNDLKPEDVMVVLDDDGRIDVTLIDLGLAAAPGRGGPGGTVAYAPPERLSGDLGGSPGTVKSDIWALGAIVFELLAGTRAYPSDQPVDARLERRRPISESPRVAAAHAWRALPSEVQNALGAALDPEPKRRPRSVRAFARALGLVEQTPVRERRPSPPKRTPAFRGSLRPGLAATGALATLVALVLAWGPISGALGIARATSDDPAACEAMRQSAARLCDGLSGEASCLRALTATDACDERARLLAACEVP